tara:strand:+ start:236 stop:703 length:468 start_codon:yes stop_codon:yes gene_type:complete
MGFQINGTTVLDSSGIQNNANSFRTLDGNSILGSGNITDSGPADALGYGNVGVYTWASILKPSNSDAVTTVDTSYTVSAGGTISASHLGCGYEHSSFELRQGLYEPSKSQLWVGGSTSGRSSSYSTTTGTGYSGTWRNMLTERQARYQSLFVRIS